MEICTLSFRARATGPGLHFAVRLDGTTLYSNELAETEIEIRHEFEDLPDAEHRLELELSGKLTEYTKIDSEGNILSDRVISISKMALDDIELGHAFYKNSQYHHDKNGTDQEKIDDFFGTLGCNGRVVMTFTGPVYLWLLEKL